MLGFGPLGSRPISGSPYRLIAITAAISATCTLTFSGSASTGLISYISSTVSLTFGGSARWSSLNSISATATLTFDGSARLRVAGRPIVFTAIPDSWNFRAQVEDWTLTALNDNFVFRGVP